ncbi:MAG: hypothetical protein JNL13_13930 [Chitinophagaceae bacterium]|nr:hypothetical protein [Chitinophagaceae bacterium]
MSIMHFRYTATEYTVALLCGLLVSCSMACLSCKPAAASEYEAFRSLVPGDAPLDKDKHIALLLYNPQGCTPCNYILSNLFGNPGYADLFGKNSFVVFPSVRPSELKDYDRLFKTYGNVTLQFINDKRLFDLLRKKGKEKLGGRPRWLGLNETAKECICFDLKDKYLADSIMRYFTD